MWRERHWSRDARGAARHEFRAAGNGRAPARGHGFHDRTDDQSGYAHGLYPRRWMNGRDQRPEALGPVRPSGRGYRERSRSNDFATRRTARPGTRSVGGFVAVTPRRRPDPSALTSIFNAYTGDHIIPEKHREGHAGV